MQADDVFALIHVAAGVWGAWGLWRLTRAI